MIQLIWIVNKIQLQQLKIKIIKMHIYLKVDSKIDQALYFSIIPNAVVYKINNLIELYPYKNLILLIKWLDINISALLILYSITDLSKSMGVMTGISSLILMVLISKVFKL
jgi:hypothetical protein